MQLPLEHLNLRFNPFGELTRAQRAAVAEVDVDLVEGEVLQVMGEMGRGKTTHLLALCARHEVHRPRAGDRRSPVAPRTPLHAHPLGPVQPRLPRLDRAHRAGLGRRRGQGRALRRPKPGQVFEVDAPPEPERWWPELPWDTAEQHPLVATRNGDPNDRYPAP